MAADSVSVPSHDISAYILGLPAAACSGAVRPTTTTMDCVQIAVVIAALLVLAWVIDAKSRGFKYSSRRVKTVRASDGSLYKVHSDHSQTKNAAEIMAYLHDWSIDLIEHLRNKYTRTAEGDAYPERKQIVKRILARYDPDSLAEGSPLNSQGDTSYVLNKGEEFVMCLREKNPKLNGRPDVHDFHDLNTLCFVKTHELAHLGVDVPQHPPEFWQCFKFLLQEAIPIAPGGVWENYDEFPVNYCGLTIDYNPLNDIYLQTPN